MAESQDEVLVVDVSPRDGLQILHVAGVLGELNEGAEDVL